MRRAMETLVSNANGNCKTIFGQRAYHYAARVALTFLAVLFLAGLPAADAQAPSQSMFSTPDEAMQALITAVKAHDRSVLQAIFGSDYEQLLSGDNVEDANDLNDFAQAVTESAELQKAGESKYVIVVGQNKYPMPIPIVPSAGKWIFDTKAGLEEVLNRRIGENELSAINTCRAYAIAQWEYFTEGDWDHDGLAEYAQKFISSPGEHNGLYWETPEGEKPSPLGKLVASARDEGYGPRPRSSAASENPSKDASATEAKVYPRAPYHGYFFRILKAQGPHAPGGKYSYVINGNMIAGYALIAYPDKWGNSGVMTFIINQQGRVYQKNLGPDTAKIVATITEYDPDPSWKRVEAQP